MAPRTQADNPATTRIRRPPLGRSTAHIPRRDSPPRLQCCRPIGLLGFASWNSDCRPPALFGAASEPYPSLAIVARGTHHPIVRSTGYFGPAFAALAGRRPAI